MQIIKIGFSSSEKTKECENSPDLILNELKNIESNEKGNIIFYNSLNIETIHVTNNINEGEYMIFENSKEYFSKNDKTIFLGGDNFISFPILKAFFKQEKNPFLIIFDSKADLINLKKDPYKGWLRKLLDSGFSPSSIVIISARNFSINEMDLINKLKIQVVKMDVLYEDIEGICDVIMERARSSSGFFISIDVSCVDPGFSPGSIEIEPGGISSRDLIYFLKRLLLLNNFKGLDIVNIDSTKDINNMTVKLGVKIVSETI